MTQISSLPAGAKAGNLTGVVTNDSDRAARAEVSVRVMRRKTGGALIGKTSVDVAAHGTKTFLVGVKVPNLKKGTYYVAACTPQGGADKGALGCATSAADLKIQGGDPVRGKLAQRQFEAQGKARAAQAQCSPGARTLVKPGDRVWPELGNGGYQSIHSDVFINYDAVTNKFLPGTHVELTQKSTQCLSEFSLDFDRQSSISQHGGRAGLGHDDPVDHDRRRPGHVRAPSADATPATRTARTIPTRSRTPRRTPTRSRRPTRTRRRARRPATTRPSRASSAVRPSS